MTPAARYAAAIDVLDAILSGAVAERAITQWARSNRFAGSKDRAAIRDHVFDVLRAKRSLSAIGDAQTARGMILGLLRRDGIAPETVFGAGDYGPSALTDAESRAPNVDINAQTAEMCDLPDWLWPDWQESLGDQAVAAARIQQRRAGIFLRVNLRKTDVEAARIALAEDGISTHVVPEVKTCLQVTENERRILQSHAYLNGWVELQDTASQMAMLALNVPQDARVLDYCAGGGGKALALADIYGACVTAHDSDPRRMGDLDARAKRAGVTIVQRNTDALSKEPPFDVVLCDAPCSGSGTWRRTPEAKWGLTSDKLHYYNELQREILAKCASLTTSTGVLAYATCSVLRAENDEITAQFLSNHPDWRSRSVLRLYPTELHDGFYLNVFTPKNTR
ncbi:16S rRNA (cytosine967-C5)-methyltransferase [Cognatiyoonia koreensis]|uniref:16S rRNA (Cytosine967-C5)-methyltransferase n=1 Tax=Cognatiyoonia koreensis TaxID=364200 RepID=A0A1I0PGR7_9RHOB|nr:RsmB/NOP family class I SAM-dependent RNA methyltransferase [Cognatiyoonia koreensis]SEW13385.1 16S rRNA (cytosine967-C5)-methyltransferase [Cognatiyoonia koreensis]